MCLRIHMGSSYTRCFALSDIYKSAREDIMAQDMFIKIDGIEGESLDANHKKRNPGISLELGCCSTLEYAQRFRWRFR